jgi:hypothetical protein
MVRHSGDPPLSDLSRSLRPTLGADQCPVREEKTMVTPRNIEPQDAFRPARPRDKDFGLVVGVDHYSKIPPLSGARADARRFYKWMRRPSGGGVLREHARLIVSKRDPPTPLQQQIDEALVDLMMRADAIGGGRRLYFHFSGHGAVSSTAANQDVALLLAAWSTLFDTRALSSDHYCNYVVRVGLFHEVAIFLDCCRTVTGKVRGAAPSFDLTPLTTPCRSTMFVAHATSHGDQAFEVGRGKEARGVFTDCLLSILRASREPLTVAALRKKLKDEVEGKNQNACVLTNFDEQSTFGRGTVEVRLKVTFRSVRDGKVYLYDDRLAPIGEHQVSAEPWVLDLPPGAYLLEHGTTRGIKFDHGRKEVTHVEF